MKKLLLAAVALMFTATACPVDPPATTNFAACPTAGPGQIQVAVVVEGISNPAHQVVCVVVADGANGLAALDARSARLGTTARRMDPSNGLLCAIDATPATGCGESGPDGFSFWNYSFGGASWESANIGPASQVLHQGSVEGYEYGTWNFTTTFPGPLDHSPSFSVLTGS